MWYSEIMIPYSIYKIQLLFRKQITKTLPVLFWKKVIIHENNEPLVDYCGFQVRKAIAEKLDYAKKKLPQGISLKLLDGYRSLERQRQVWDRKWDIVKSENPNWSDDKIDQEVRLVVARPYGITNHVCGGAVDVCLMNESGEMLDFGTEYAAAGEASRRKCPMFASDLTPEQVRNRKILRDTMTSAGFVYYPGEWWHYCYGDRMWAVYTGRSECFYGPVANH